MRFNSNFLRKTSCSNVESVRSAGCEPVVVQLAYTYTALVIFEYSNIRAVLDAWTAWTTNVCASQALSVDANLVPCPSVLAVVR
jgi:hypothetical protein